jgi:competence protein ComEA
MKKILFLIASLVFGASPVLAVPVNINQADAEQIASALNGIGLKKAEAIVAYRNEHGQFESVDDLALVKGIGDQLVSKLRHEIILEQP